MAFVKIAMAVAYCWNSLLIKFLLAPWVIYSGGRVVKIKVLTKGKLKLAWGMSVFLAKEAVFSQVNCLHVNVMSGVFKDSIQLFS
jgi:hypothetical protein